MTKDETVEWLESLCEYEPHKSLENSSPKQAIHLIETLSKEVEGLKGQNLKMRQRNLINGINAICGECGHTKTEDGCPFCIQKANVEEREKLQTENASLRRDKEKLIHMLRYIVTEYDQHDFFSAKELLAELTPP